MTECDTHFLTEFYDFRTTVNKFYCQMLISNTTCNSSDNNKRMLNPENDDHRTFTWVNEWCQKLDVRTGCKTYVQNYRPMKTLERRDRLFDSKLMYCTEIKLRNISVGQDQLRNFPSRSEKVPFQIESYQSNDLLHVMNLTDHNCFWTLTCLAHVILNSQSSFDCWSNCPGLHTGMTDWLVVQTDLVTEIKTGWDFENKFHQLIQQGTFSWRQHLA